MDANQWPVSKVKQTFLDFFVQRGHTLIPSSSVVLEDDPTLLFTNAGMNQFKSIFLGAVQPTSPLANLQQATSIQKCIRAGGKHNDLENVGKDLCRHSFFEMLGNWSFGNYWKEEALSMSWELLTKVYQLPEDRFYVTYFQGDARQCLDPDYESRDIWRKLGIPEERIVQGNCKDNFWEMGSTGPCGPSSEIHFDLIGNRDASSIVNTSDDSVLEIWNNVFISFSRQVDGSLEPLPQRHVDTGMGLERLVSILQSKTSNYDTDIFEALLNSIYKICTVKNPTLHPYGGKVGSDDVGNVDSAYRIVADHTRTLCIAIADGQMPDNSGRGYVLRKIFRRAHLVKRTAFVVEDRSFWVSLCQAFVELMEPSYPSLRGKLSTIISVLDKEEEAFDKVIQRCEKSFLQLAQSVHSSELTGEEIWKLYETHGFPTDLMACLAEERGLKMDWGGFELMKRKSKKGTKPESKGALET
ncbi:alanyl-tRNA synthetase [Atractiella rhizophila]|nr:alanyl-tRNA synthetase [Atractiella rhizophila]